MQGLWPVSRARSRLGYTLGMANPAQRRMSIDEYLAFEETASERHEYLDGEIFAMSGGTRAHDFLSGAVFAELRAALRGKPCSPAASNLRVKSQVTGLYTYPDALVHCAPKFENAKETTLLNPRVIVEVLSPGTEGYDRGEKFRHYRSIPSVAEYVLVSTTDQRVEVYARREKTWELSIHEAGQEVVLASIEVRLSVEELYRGVTLEPVPAPPVER